MDKPEIEQRIELLEQKIKEKETSLFRAISTFSKDMNDYRSGKSDQFPNASFMGLVYAVLKRRMIIVMGSLVAMIFTGAQLWLLYNQNKLMELQNDKIDIQSRLSESARRGDVYLLIGNIYESIQEELRVNRDSPERRGELSTGLVGQIISLSHSLKPYRYLQENGELSEPISRERGNLLLYLTHLKLKTEILSEILRKGDFDRMELSNTVISDASISFDSIAYASMNNVEFQNCLIKGDFRKSIFQKTKFSKSKLDLILNGEGSLYLHQSSLGFLKLSNSKIEFLESTGDSTRIELDSSEVGHCDFRGSYKLRYRLCLFVCHDF